ncbi:4-hydroxy-3-methylbut-2-enyl diphosphate reductase [Ruminococcaceae bacterium YRB3002]|nr:4-hydroxy-3-methylbut-2-enyl diphosphate reductase [Ruminococcaceae bacterium YRB3002]
MPVRTAESSGFCFGVKHAVETAHRMLADRDDKVNSDNLVMLGELIHNEIVLKELTEGGFVICNSASEVPEGSVVLVRAHGVPPSEMRILEEKGCSVVDCTCPFVSKIHKIVAKAASEGKNIIVTGGKGHPEVLGICGYAEGYDVKVAVIGSVGELEEVPFAPESSILVSQTTFSAEEFNKICAIIKNKIANNCIFDTICSTTENRQKEAAKLASDSDVMLVIGSAASSNTTKLLGICKSRCVRTYLISDVCDAERIVAEGLVHPGDKVGITAGASTPEAIILEVVHTMDENDKKTNQDQEQTDVSFAEALESFVSVKRNTVVKGEITSADADFVYVDVHDKSEGKIPRKEFAQMPDFDLEAALANHEEISVHVKSIKNSDQGKDILLSILMVESEKNKKIVEEAFNNKTPIDVTITKVVKDGIIGVIGGIEVYIHRSQICLGQPEELESYVGQTMTIRVTKFDTDKHRLRISGSHKALDADARKAKADAIWSDIEVGKTYKGIVRSLPNFGAFIDIGGVDGLCHNTDLSWQRISKPSDVLSIGQEVEVTVKSFDPETKKISLVYKKEEDDPFYMIEERIPVGSIVKGKVVRLTDFGAFVELEPGVDALCHVSQISSGKLDKPSDVLSVGQEVVAKVTKIQTEDGQTQKTKISISIKEVQPIDPETPDEEIEYSEADAHSETPDAEPAVEEAPVEAAPAEDKPEE